MTSDLQAQREYWNREAEAFDTIYGNGKGAGRRFLDRIFRKDMYERFAFTMEHSAPVEGKTFLDVGCGSGVYSVELAKSRARHVTGIDISPAMLELSRARAEREGVGARCTFVQSDLLAFPADERVDVTIGIGLFDYIRDPLPVLSAMRRITSDTAILSFPRLWTWRAPIRKMRLTLRGCEVYFYSKKRVTELLRDAGFSDITVTKVGKLHCVVVS